MPPADAAFTDQVPSGFHFLSDLLFRWVPASVIAVSNTISGTTTSPFKDFTDPVSIWSVPALLHQAADAPTYDWLTRAWVIFSGITLIASIPFVAVVIYCWIRIMQIRRKERRGFEAAQKTVVLESVPKTQLRWNRVIDQAASGTPEHWRLAILEADIMLGELLDLQGYKGETMAEKMKRVDRANFNTIDLAWEAHKIRNRVAHEGSAMDLSAREVRRVISLYERVFREFRYIE